MSRRNYISKNPQVFDANRVIFSENQRISLRQIRRTLTLEIFGISSLMLPGFLARQSGIWGIFSMALGCGGAIILLFFWNRWSQRTEFQELFGNSKNIGQRIIFVIGGFGLLLIASYVLYILITLVKNQLLEEKYTFGILISLTVAGVFGLWKGLESRLRVYEVLFWFLLVPLIAILILACVSVKPAYWTMTSCNEKGFIYSTYVSFLFFSIASLILFFKPQCSQPKKAAGHVRRSLYLVLGLNIFVYLILIGIFQDHLLSELQFPVILLMSVVKLPGEFFERQDALMMGIWFFCLFALFHSMLFYGKNLIQAATVKKEFLWSGLSGGIVFAITWLLLREKSMAELVLQGILRLWGPVLLVLPLVFSLFRRKSKRK